MHRHTNQYRNEIFFVRCKDSAYCQEWCSKKIKLFLENFEFKLQAPVFYKQWCGHYKTFLHRSQSNDNFYGHDKQPTSVKAGLGKCDFCPLKTEKTRHLSLFYDRQKKAHVEPTHKCIVCGKAYASLASLNRHKKKEKHTPNEKLVYRKSPLQSQRKPAKVRDLRLRRVKPNNQPPMTCFAGENQQEMMRITLMKTRNVPPKVTSSVSLQIQWSIGSRVNHVKIGTTLPASKINLALKINLKIKLKQWSTNVNTAVRIWWYYNKLFVVENVLLVNFSKFLHTPSKPCNKYEFQFPHKNHSVSAFKLSLNRLSSKENVLALP